MCVCGGRGWAGRGLNLESVFDLKKAVVWCVLDVLLFYEDGHQNASKVLSVGLIFWGRIPPVLIGVS